MNSIIRNLYSDDKFLCLLMSKLEAIEDELYDECVNPFMFIELRSQQQLLIDIKNKYCDMCYGKEAKE